MSTTTSGNLKLTKPAYSDPADINVINADLDAIDTAVSAVQDSISNLRFLRGTLTAAQGSNVLSLTFNKDIAIFIGSRLDQGSGFILIFDYWSAGYTAIGNLYNTTIEKKANSRDVTITRNAGLSIGYIWVY